MVVRVCHIIITFSVLRVCTYCQQRGIMRYCEAYISSIRGVYSGRKCICQILDDLDKLDERECADTIYRKLSQTRAYSPKQ